MHRGSDCIELTQIMFNIGILLTIVEKAGWHHLHTCTIPILNNSSLCQQH